MLQNGQIYHFKQLLTITIKGKFYSEYDIAEQLSFVKEIANSKEYNLPTMDGAISILYKGEEFLGKEYWDEIMTVDIKTFELLKGKPFETYMPIAGQFLKFTPHDELVKYELRYVKTKNSITKSRYLPLLSFVRKWAYMRYRLLRVKAFLTDAEEAIKGWESWGYGTDQWKNVIGVDKINAILRDDIIDILIDDKYRE